MRLYHCPADLSVGATRGDARDAKLMTARDNAVKSLAAERAAVARLAGAGATLTKFVGDVIAAADTAVMDAAKLCGS